jgi:hypothetical protein
MEPLVSLEFESDGRPLKRLPEIDQRVTLGDPFFALTGTNVSTNSGDSATGVEFFSILPGTNQDSEW